MTLEQRKEKKNCFLFCFVLLLETEPQGSRTLGKQSTLELHALPIFIFILRQEINNLPKQLLNLICCLGLSLVRS